MLLSGQAIAAEIQEEIRQAITKLNSPPGLAVILIGDNPGSKVYVSRKQEACHKVGINSFLHQFPQTLSEKSLLKLVGELNHDNTVHGILVQLPLPDHIDAKKVIESIDPRKDVDGFHPINMGRLLLGLSSGFVPCTPLGIKTLLERYEIAVEAKEVVILGRSNIVGKPLAALLMQNAPHCNATVTVVHSRTPDIKTHTLRADILVAAMGSARFIKADMVKEGAVVVDVGINREEGRIVGDVDFIEVEKKCRAITPVPKGVGPMTVAMLLQNTLLSRMRLS